MSTARPRSSAARKRTAGTLRRDRLRVRTKAAASSLPAPPASLDLVGREAWERFGGKAVKLGTFTEYDDGLLELACRTWGQIAELETLLRRDGYMVISGNVRKANPCCVGLDRARALMHKMLADFGLSPPSRERLTLAPPSGDDPAERYFT